MLSNILTLVLLVTFSACKKEYKSEDNRNVETVSELNSGNYKKVINTYEDKKDLTGRERYYLASAYSQSGNVDVYSLYAVMEIQLFHKNALEWSDLSKEKNPYLKFMKSQEGVNYEERAKKRAANWKRYEAQIREKEGMKPKPTMDEIKEGSGEAVRKDDYNRADEILSKKAAEILTSALESEEKINVFWAFVDEMNLSLENSDVQMICSNWLSSYYADEIRLEEMKRKYLNPESSTDKFSDVRWEMLYMNVLWNTYEAIPVMKKLPTLSNENQEQIGLALDHYFELLKDPNFKEVAIKNILVLASVSLLSIYKESFDLNNVDSIQDLYCSFEADSILNNYGTIRKRIFFLHNAYEQAGIEIKELKGYKQSVEDLKDQVPEELNQEQKDSFVKGIDKFKVDSCFNG